MQKKERADPRPRLRSRLLKTEYYPYRQQVSFACCFRTSCTYCRHILVFAATLQDTLDLHSDAGTPDLTAVLGTALEAFKNKPDAERQASTLRALVDATAAYLWTRPDHGGIKHTSSFGIFPFCGLDDEEGEISVAAGASQQGSVVGVGDKLARPPDEEPSMAELHAALDAEHARTRLAQLLREAGTLAEAASTPALPKKTKARTDPRAHNEV